MLLDSGIVAIMRQKNISAAGEMPEYKWDKVWESYYGEKTDNSDLSYRIPPDDRGFSGYA